MAMNSISAVESVNYQANDNETDTPIHLTNITGTNLEQLNEDCLLEIFKLLTPVDLCSLAGTCKRFGQITQGLLPNEVDIEESEYEFIFSSDGHPPMPIKPAIVECFFSNFGSRLSKLSVQRWNKLFLDSIAKNHEAITLKQLDILANFPHDKDSLMGCWDSTYPNITGQLVVLEVNMSIGVWVASHMSKHTFPNLERFTFQRNDNYLVEFRVEINLTDTNRNEAFLAFFDRHTCLRTLKFTEVKMPLSLSHPPIQQGCSTDYRFENLHQRPTRHDYSNYIDHYVVKNSTKSDKLTLPESALHKIVMYTT